MRQIVGVLLTVAALLKALELYHLPESVLGDSYSRFLTPLLFGGELGLGLFAIAGLYWRQLRPLAMILFAGFACYSLWLALQGAASCGCFGQLEINPWWTFLLDVIVFLGLLMESLTKRQGKSNNADDLAQLPVRVQLIGIATISLAMVLGVAWHVTPKRAASQEGFQTVGDLVILEPESWVGQEFPLSEHIDMDVSHGNWVVLLHRQDCHDCQAALPKYEQLAMLGTHYQVAIIEVPPYDTLHETQASHCRVGRLSDLREWFVQTPIEIAVVDGIVKTASTELPSLRGIDSMPNNEMFSAYPPSEKSAFQNF